MADLIFVVDDTQKWHEENYKLNRDHYSGLIYYFGTGMISKLNNKIFPAHWNPFIKLEEHNVVSFIFLFTLSKMELKYGVV